MTEKSASDRAFKPLAIAVLTVSDSRTEADDKSGKLLVGRLQSAGHVVSAWIADPAAPQVILTTGGTGVTGRDGTPEAVTPLLDKEIPGFGEMFRNLSWASIKTSTLQSRALAGVANATYVFCLPGSSGACADAWDQLIEQQLDYRTRPSNLVELMPRLLER